MGDGKFDCLFLSPPKTLRKREEVILLPFILLFCCKRFSRFKILLLAFKAIHDLAPAYISNLLVISYNIRSNSGILLEPPRGKMLSTLGEHAFQAAAPHLWNELRLQLRTIGSVENFKNSIKTFLFKQSFQ